MSILSRVASFPSQIADAVELALIKAAGNGDSRAFAKLVSKYERRLRFFGMRFFKNDTDCDDFIQEVFIKVFTGLHSFKGDSQFSTWLMRIAYNTAVNTIKSHVFRAKKILKDKLSEQLA